MTTLVLTGVRSLNTKALSYVSSILGLVAIQIATIYLLLPVGVQIWRLLTCPC